ncbi:MAG: hypothetical protein Q4B01_04245 [Eubacteriales bacterium]|nr:hypothetical protein [Eubacteriales bacterium]
MKSAGYHFRKYAVCIIFMLFLSSAIMPLKAAAAKKIFASDVRVKVTPPEAGAPPTFTAKSDAPTVYSAEIGSWTTDKIGITAVNVGDFVFQPFYIYNCNVEITIKDDYMLSNTSYGYINGNEAKMTKNGTKTYVLTYQFPYLYRTTLTDSDITLTLANVPYNGGKTAKPGVTVYHSGRRLTESKDYSVTYEEATKVGTAKLTVYGRNLYNGSVVKTYNIVPAELPMDLEMSLSTAALDGKSRAGDKFKCTFSRSLPSSCSDSDAVYRWQYSTDQLSWKDIEESSGGASFVVPEKYAGNYLRVIFDAYGHKNGPIYSNVVKLEQTYAVSVINGTAIDTETDMTVTKANAGDIFYLIADEPVSGMKFDKWDIRDANTGAVIALMSDMKKIAYTMPARAIKAEAVYTSTADNSGAAVGGGMTPHIKLPDLPGIGSGSDKGDDSKTGGGTSAGSGSAQNGGKTDTTKPADPVKSNAGNTGSGSAQNAGKTDTTKPADPGKSNAGNTGSGSAQNGGKADATKPTQPGKSGTDTNGSASNTGNTDPKQSDPTTITADPQKKDISFSDSVKIGKIKKKSFRIRFQKVPKATGYEIHIAENKKFTKNHRVIRIKKTSTIIKKLRPGKTYYVKVRAFTQKKAKAKRKYQKFSAVQKVKTVRGK